MKTKDLVEGTVYACKDGYVRQGGPYNMWDIRAMRFEGMGEVEATRWSKNKSWSGEKNGWVAHGPLFFKVEKKGKRFVTVGEKQMVRPADVYGEYEEVAGKIRANEAALEAYEAEKERKQRDATAAAKRLKKAVEAVVKTDDLVVEAAYDRWNTGNRRITISCDPESDAVERLIEAFEAANGAVEEARFS